MHFMAIGYKAEEMKLQCAKMLTKSVTNRNDKVAFVKVATATCDMLQWNEIILPSLLPQSRQAVVCPGVGDGPCLPLHS